MDQKKKRRNSILKKTPCNEDDTTGDVTTKIKRRISFSGKKSVKEFTAGEEQATIWGTSYEEAADGLQANPTESGLVNVNEKRIVLRSRRVIVEPSRGNKRRSKKNATVAENDKENICVQQPQEDTTAQSNQPIQFEQSKPEIEPIIAEVEPSKAVHTEIVRFAGTKSDCLLNTLDRGNICSNTFDFINFSGLENRTISIEQSVDVTLTQSELQMFKFRVPVEAKHFSPILSLSSQPDVSPSTVFSPSILMSEEDKQILKFMRENKETIETQTVLKMTHVTDATEVQTEPNVNMDLAETIKKNDCGASSMDLTEVDGVKEAHATHLSMAVSHCEEIESRDSKRRTVLKSVDMEEDLPKSEDFNVCQKSNGDQKRATIHANQTMNTSRREDLEVKSLKRKTITQSVAMEQSCVWTDRKVETNQNVMNISEMDFNSPMRKKPMHNAASKPMDITMDVVAQSNSKQVSTKRQTICFESAAIEESFTQEIEKLPTVNADVGNENTQVGTLHKDLVEADHKMVMELYDRTQVSKLNAKDRQTICDPTDMISEGTAPVEQKVSQKSIYIPCDMIEDSPGPKVIYQKTSRMKTDVTAEFGKCDSLRKSINTPTDMILDSPKSTSSIPRPKSMPLCQQMLYSSVDMDEDVVQSTQTLQTSSKKRESVYTPSDIIEDSPTSSTSIMPSELKVKARQTFYDATDLSLYQSPKIKHSEMGHDKTVNAHIAIFEDCTEPSVPPIKSATPGPKVVIRHLNFEQAQRDDQILRKLKVGSKETMKPIVESKLDDSSMDMTMLGDLSDSENKMNFFKLNEKLLKGELKSLGGEEKNGKMSLFENLNQKSVDEVKLHSLMMNEPNGNDGLIQPPRNSMRDYTMDLSTRKTDYTIDFSLHSVNKLSIDQRQHIEQKQTETPHGQTIHFNKEINSEESKTSSLKEAKHLVQEGSMNISGFVVSKASNRSKSNGQTVHLDESLGDDHIEGKTHRTRNYDSVHPCQIKSGSFVVRPKQSKLFSQHSGLEANLLDDSSKDDSAMEVSMIPDESKYLEQKSPLKQSFRQVMDLHESKPYAVEIETPKIQRRQTIHCNEDLELDDTISIRRMERTEHPESYKCKRQTSHTKQIMDLQQSELYAVETQSSKPLRRETIHLNEDLELDDLDELDDTIEKREGIHNEQWPYKTELPEPYESKRPTTHTKQVKDLQQSKRYAVQTQPSKPQRRETIHLNEDLELDDTIPTRPIKKSGGIHNEEWPHKTEHPEPDESKRQTTHTKQIMDLQQSKRYAVQTQSSKPQGRETIHFNEDLELDVTIPTLLERREHPESVHTRQVMDLQQSRLYAVEIHSPKPQRRETIHFNEDLELDDTIPTRSIEKSEGIHNEEWPHKTEHPEPDESKRQTTHAKQIMDLQQSKRYAVHAQSSKPQGRETIHFNEDLELDDTIPTRSIEKSEGIHNEERPHKTEQPEPYESKGETTHTKQVMDLQQSKRYGVQTPSSKPQQRETIHFNEDLELDVTIPTLLEKREHPETVHTRQVMDLQQSRLYAVEIHSPKPQRRETIHFNEDLELDDTIPTRPIEKSEGIHNEECPHKTEHPEPDESKRQTTHTKQITADNSKRYAVQTQSSKPQGRETIHFNEDLELDVTIPTLLERTEHPETTHTRHVMALQQSRLYAVETQPPKPQRRETIHYNEDIDLNETLSPRPIERNAGVHREQLSHLTQHAEAYESKRQTSHFSHAMDFGQSKLDVPEVKPSKEHIRQTMHSNEDLQIKETIHRREYSAKPQRRQTVHCNEDLELDDMIPSGPKEKSEYNNEELLPSQSSKQWARPTTHFNHDIKQKIYDHCADLKQEFKVQDATGKPLSSKIPIRHTLHFDEDIELEKENKNETRRNTVHNALRVLSRPTMHFHQTIDIESESKTDRIELVKTLPKPRRLTIHDEQPIDIDESPKKFTPHKSSFIRTLNFNEIQTASSKVKQKTVSVQQNPRATIADDDSPLYNFKARSRLNDTTSEIDRSLAEYLKAETAATLRNSPEISMDVSNSGQKNLQTANCESSKANEEQLKSRRQTSHEPVNIFEESGMQPLLQRILKRQTTFASKDTVPEEPAKSVTKNVQTYLHTSANSMELKTSNKSKTRYELSNVSNIHSEFEQQKQERSHRQLLLEPEYEEYDNCMEISMAADEPIKSTARSTLPSRKTIHFTNENAVDESFFDENLYKPAASQTQMKRQTQLYNENQCPMEISLAASNPPPKSGGAQSMKEILLESEKLFSKIELPTFDNKRSTVYLNDKNRSMEKSFDTVEIPRRATTFQKNDISNLLPNQDEFAETTNLTQKSPLKFEDAPITVSDVSTYFSQQMILANKPINETFSHNTTEALCKLEVSQFTEEDDQLPKSSDSEDTTHNLAKFNKRYVELTCDSIMLSAVGEDIEKTHLSLVDTLDEMSECVQPKPAIENETSKVAGNIMISAIGEEIEKTHLSLVNTLDEISEYVQPKTAIEAEFPKVVHSTRPLKGNASVCRKCKRHRLSETQNETTIGSFMLEPLPVYKMDLDALEELGSKPKISDVAKLWRQKMRESDSFNISDGSQSNGLDETDLLNVNEFIATLDKERLAATQCMEKKEVKIKSSFVQRVRKKVESKNSNWILNELLPSSGILKFDHTRIGTFTIFIKFTPKDTRATEVDLSGIQLVPNNQSCKWSAFDYALHYQLLVELPFDISTLCPTSEHLFQFLDHVDNVTQKVLKTGRDMWYLVLTSPASLIRESSGRLYIQKIARTKTPQNEVKRIEFQIEVRNINKISYKSIVQPPLYEFDEMIQTLPEGLAFLTIFLSDPVGYTKSSI